MSICCRPNLYCFHVPRYSIFFFFPNFLFQAMDKLKSGEPASC